MVACLSVSVKAELLWGSQSSSFQFSNISGTNLPSGNVQLFTYSDWINVPFDKYNYSRDYYFNGDFESIIPVQVQFPAEWAGRYITGRFSIAYTLSHPVQFFYQSGQTFAQSVFADYTERYQIFIDNENVTDGLTVSVAPTGDTGASDYIVVNYVFNDFYIPIAAASNTSYRFGFDLKYHFSFNASYHKTGTADYEAGVLTALTSNCQLVSPSVHADAVMNGGSVQLSNEYYTLLQALYNSDIDLLLTGLNDYFTSWIGEPSSAITNNWADFSAEVINKLGAIATLSGSNSPLIPAINNIYTLLFNAMAQDGYLTTWFTDIYDLIDSNGTTLSNIYWQSSNDYAESTGTYLANIYFALTGQQDIVGDITQSALTTRMFQRWRDIIVGGLNTYFGNPAYQGISASEAAQYATQVADVDSGVSTLHTEEQAAYDAAMTQFNAYVSAGFFNANIQIMPASVWYVSAINAIHSRLGKLAIPITVSFALGLIVAILGRVNRFAILTRRNSDPA